MKDEVKTLIKKLALLNAVKHDGKANPGAVVGGVIGDFPDLKKDMKSVMQEINSVVNDVNSLSIDSQKKELLKIDSSALDKKEHIVDLFGFLNIKEGDKVRTAFPPGPEKYPHIGHAKAAILNFMLAKKYGGEFYLRFEDTNPDLVKEEFYQIIQDDLKWVGVTWEKIIYASDYMDLYYKHGEELIKKGDAYYCTCSQEETSKGRETGEPCKCRSISTQENLKLWKDMPNQEKGTATIRLKIDLKHKNSTMRDPALFRINHTIHARQKDKYSVWPTYDFQNAIMDGYLEITHRIRSKEFEMRNELQRYLQTLLGYKETNIYEIGRFNLEGVESSGRKIREKIESGELIGWDDPSITTIAALRRRGFQPEAIREFVIKTGITKNDVVLTWDDLIIHNKRLLDNKADRYFFVENPVDVKVEGAPVKELNLNLHPTNKKGGRHLKTHEFFVITKEDFNNLEEGKIYRFMECFNVKYLAGSMFEYLDESIDTYKQKGKGMMHFLPKNMDLIPISVMMPDKKIKKGLAEPGLNSLKEGEIVQFERFGFVRFDNKKDMIFWFTHK